MFDKLLSTVSELEEECIDPNAKTLLAPNQLIAPNAKVLIAPNLRFAPNVKVLIDPNLCFVPNAKVTQYIKEVMASGKKFQAKKCSKIDLKQNNSTGNYRPIQIGLFRPIHVKFFLF